MCQGCLKLVCFLFRKFNHDLIFCARTIRNSDCRFSILAAMSFATTINIRLFMAYDFLIECYLQFSFLAKVRTEQLG